MNGMILPKEVCMMFAVVPPVAGLVSPASEQPILSSPNASVEASAVVIPLHSNPEAMSHIAQDADTLFGPVIAYFQTLEQQFHAQTAAQPEANEPKSWRTLATEDGFQFDRPSLQEALLFCEQVLDTLDQCTSEDFQKLQQIHPFYQTSERLLMQLKVLFAGDAVIKEKITRVYAIKAFGTAQMVKMIQQTSELFREATASEKKRLQSRLQHCVETPLKRLSLLVPQASPASLNWKWPQLKQHLQSLLREATPLFQTWHNYPLIVERFRVFLVALYGNPHLLEYVEWKHRYLQHWLYRELYHLDCRHFEPNSEPYYARIKVRIYRQAEQLFESLALDAQGFEILPLFDPVDGAILTTPIFYEDQEDKQAELQQARNHEKRFLESLNYSQLATLARKVHEEITKPGQSAQSIPERPSNAHLASLDLASEPERQRRALAATLKIHVEAAQLRQTALAALLLTTLKRIGQAFHVFAEKRLKLKPVPEIPMETRPESFPRAPENRPEPLAPVAVDWLGYGRSYKSTIYEQRLPNLQKAFFEHGSLKLYLYAFYKEAMEEVLKFYGGFGYLQKSPHRMGFKPDGTVKSLDDQAIYLTLDETSFLALGKTTFHNHDEPTFYFQFYRRHAFTPYTGGARNIDFSRQVGGHTYQMENLESATALRPLLFRGLIRVLDSLPDALRDQSAVQGLLRGMYDFFEREEARKSPLN